jgi:hypothetical protein
MKTTQVGGPVQAQTAQATEAAGIKTAVKIEGGLRVLDASLTVDKPKPGAVVDGTALLQPLLASIDKARISINVTGLEPGQKYDMLSLVGLKGDHRIGVDLTVNLDLVPKGATVNNLHLSDNFAPLSSVNIGGRIDVVAGALNGVAYDQMRL